MLQFRQANDPRELEAIYHLRYDVYCLEKEYLSACQFRDGLEYDELDGHSVSFLALNTNDGAEILGCFRLILPSDHGFPCEQHFDLIEKSPDPAHTVEMSRLIVTPGARKMWRHILMGLSKEVYLFNRENAIGYNYAAMDKSLISALQRLGLPFRIIGQSASYMGDTVPTLLCMSSIEESLPKTNLWFYDYLQASREEQEAWF